MYRGNVEEKEGGVGKKQEKGEGEEIFKRSKNTEISPEKGVEGEKKELESWMKDIGSKFERLMEEIRKDFRKQ